MVTGGAGFIGSHLADCLIENGWEVRVIDNLSSGAKENVNRLARLDVVDLKKVSEIVDVDWQVDVVFHLAANPEVRAGRAEPSVTFYDNVVSTFNLLEAMRKGNVKTHVFLSSSTVYGEASVIPTPEDYSSLRPISVYGASKLACEALSAGYAGAYGIRSLILRLANVVGPRSTHGIIPDFVRKLRHNPKRLEVLGDGTQKKSYIHVDDCVDGIQAALKGFLRSDSKYTVLNIGNDDVASSLEIARIVAGEMRLEGVLIEPTGGVDGGRGWPGDVKTMLLSIGKLRALGWAPRYSSSEAVRLAARSLLSLQLG